LQGENLANLAFCLYFVFTQGVEWEYKVAILKWAQGTHLAEADGEVGTSHSASVIF
jgi:hypothetical protein